MTSPRRSAVVMCVWAVAASPLQNAAALPPANDPAPVISGNADATEVRLPQDAAVPPSMQDTVHVVIELHEPPAAIAYAEAMKAARAVKDAAGEQARPDTNAPTRVSPGGDDFRNISPTAAREIQDRIRRIDEAQQALLPMIAMPEIGGTVLYRSQRSFNGIVALVQRDKVNELAKLRGVKSVRGITPAEVTTLPATDSLRSPVELRERSDVPAQSVHGRTRRSEAAAAATDDFRARARD